MRKQISPFVFLLLVSASSLAPAASKPSLPKMALQTSSITVSGVSSGAIMAVQMHFVHSDIVQGAGIVAGAPYGCAASSGSMALRTCMSNPSLIDDQAIVRLAQERETKGLIAKLNGLAHDQVTIFASPADTVVGSAAGEKLRAQYQTLAPSITVQMIQSPAAAHGWPTLSTGADCAKGGSPYILNCGFDLSGELLKQFYGSLLPRTAAIAANLTVFDATEFGSAAAKMADHVSLYVPAACATATRPGAVCRLHVAFHGCRQGPDAIGQQFENGVGLNEWAENNGIVVLYPKVSASTANPMGCWDWFGYTNKDYDTKDGLQIRAVRAMIDRLTGN